MERCEKGNNDMVAVSSFGTPKHHGNFDTAVESFKFTHWICWHHLTYCLLFPQTISSYALRGGFCVVIFYIFLYDPEFTFFTRYGKIANLLPILWKEMWWKCLPDILLIFSVIFRQGNKHTHTHNPAKYKSSLMAISFKQFYNEQKDTFQTIWGSASIFWENRIYGRG